MKIVVTGCPRSGTGYCAEALRRLGASVGHETWEVDGTVSWMEAPARRPGVLVVHVVRHPLLVIGSLATIAPASLHVLAAHVHGADMSLRGRAKIWLGWTTIAAAGAMETVPTEEFAEKAPGFLRRAGIAVRDTADHALVPKDMNSRPHAEVTWEHLRKEDAFLATMVETRARKWRLPL